MTQDLKIFWAHVDGTGKIVSWGQANGEDVFRQTLSPGLTCVARPEHVNGFENWRYVNNDWTLLP